MKSSISIHFSATIAILHATCAGWPDCASDSPLPSPFLPSDSHPTWRVGRLSKTRLPASTLRALDSTSYLSRTYRKNSKELDLFIAFLYAAARAKACTLRSTVFQARVGKSGSTIPR
jgi:hypothetical protein